MIVVTKGNAGKSGPLTEPSSDQVRHVMALLESGQAKAAIVAVQKLLKVHPNAAVLHLIHGAAFAGQENLERAIKSFRQALVLQPDYLAALNNLAVIYRKAGKLAEAEECYARAVRLQPENADVWFNFGLLREAAGKLEEAAETYAKVVALKPRHGDALNNLGVILHTQGRLHEAAETLEKAHQVQPAHLQILRNLGAVLEKLPERADDLVAIDRKILAVDPGHIITLGSFANKEIAAGRPAETTLRRVTAIPSQAWQDVATAMWAALMHEGPEKAFSFTSKRLNTVPYDEMARFYRDPTLAARLEALSFVEGGAPVVGEGPVILAAASGDYAELFAHDLVSSALAKSQDATVHLHIMNPGSFDAARVFAAFPKARVSYSVEALGAVDKTLYATRRFVLLSKFLAQAQRPFLVIDVDSLFNLDPSAWVRDLGPVDAAIYERRDQPFISQMVAAGALVVAPTENGRAFADFIASYILHFEAAGAEKWYLDQLAILTASIWFEDRLSAAIVSLPLKTLDLSGDRDPDSMIWTTKGGEKRKLAPDGS